MEFFNSVGGDPLRPSLFELIAQEQLRDLLQPALKYVLAVFAQRYPRYLLRIVNKHEEFYAVLMYLVERHYLRTQNASFAENFYGLKRRRRPFFELERKLAAVGGVPEGEKLRMREVNRSLLFLVGVPYLRAKAHDYFEELGGGVEPDLAADTGMNQSQESEAQGMKHLFREWFRKLYPWLNTTFELWLLAYNAAYVFDWTPTNRPWLSWVGVDIRRLGVEDLRSAAAPQIKTSQPQSPRVFPWIWRLFLASPRLLFDSLRLLLPSAMFFIKFLEWWYSPGSPARALSTTPLGPVVPSPRILLPHPKGVPFNPTQYGQCPICHEPFRNATALPSGYVACYRCAYDHVERHGLCPVTLTPARVFQLRKVLV